MAGRHPATPISVRNVLGQALVVVLILALLAGFVLQIRRGLELHGIPFGFSFLGRSAGFDISEGQTVVLHHGTAFLQPYQSSDANWQAFVTGLYNTIKVSVLGIALSTLLGIIGGASRVSANWLVRQLSFAVIEAIRNTPLLVQLFFWYFAVVLKLPVIAHASALYGSLVLSRQGIYLPAFTASAAWAHFQWFFYAGVALAAVTWAFGRSTRTRVTGSAGALALWLLGIGLFGLPFTAHFPVTGRFSVAGGIGLSPEFSAILLALVAYTAAFIAEIVRGAIQSVSRGQWEAALALGLTRGEALREIILPQAFRIMVPPLGNQYLNLAKNTSLAIAIGFPDLFNVYGTIANQTGRSLEGILIVMGAYLVLNWLISGLVNLYNRRLLARGART